MATFEREDERLADFDRLFAAAMLSITPAVMGLKTADQYVSLLSSVSATLTEGVTMAAKMFVMVHCISGKSTKEELIGYVDSYLAKVTELCREDLVIWAAEQCDGAKNK